eukprot:2087667-Amphidinium_carterae.1
MRWPMAAWQPFPKLQGWKLKGGLAIMMARNVPGRPFSNCCACALPFNLTLTAVTAPEPHHSSKVRKLDADTSLTASKAACAAT